MGGTAGSGGTNENPPGWFESNTHEKIKSIMMPYAEKNRTLNVGELKERLGIRQNFPTAVDPRSGWNICINNTLGRCTFFNCGFAHVPGNRLPRDYVTQVCEIIRPGMNEWARTQNGGGRGGSFSGGGNSWRNRGSANRGANGGRRGGY